jgi:hypothetical protein
VITPKMVFPCARKYIYFEKLQKWYQVRGNNMKEGIELGSLWRE